MVQRSIDTETIYIFALGLLKGVGTHAHRHLVSSFPIVDMFQQASLKTLEQILRPSLANSIYEQVHQSAEVWSQLLQEANEAIQQHIQLGIELVPITSSLYPPLLKKIPDPPVILYAKGNTSLLCNSNTVAIVGTREPTSKGENVARHLAKYFARRDYCVVSGLAKGIDSAAHEGALEVHGRTIAVLATPLNQVYPAANKDLAQRIIDTNGLLLGELPLGQKGFRSAFVQRDRIQSGLSLAVIPVQTKVDGGTMHTVNFAKMQKRLIACPIPLRVEGQMSQYEGIYALLRGNNPLVYPFKAGDIDQSDILEHLQDLRQRLLATQIQVANNQATDNEVLPSVPKANQVPEENQVQFKAITEEKELEILQLKEHFSSLTPQETLLSLPMPSKEMSKRPHTRKSVEQRTAATRLQSELLYETSRDHTERRVAEPSELYQVESRSGIVQTSLWRHKL